ncbi:MAG: tetratricopeptide repeat protein [Opitutales bacterium]|nr:tetratricopeptide repeat protein [Opitutales bacterium]
MTKSNRLKIAITSLLGMAGLVSVHGQLEYDPATFWDQPHIRAAYIGDYEIDVAKNPKLTETESEVFREILEVMKTDKDAALQMLKANITPDSSGSLEFIIGSLYGEKGDNESAMEWFLWAIGKYPNFLRAQRNLAIMMVQSGEFEKAKKHFVKAIDLGSRDSTTFGLLGLCYVNGGQFISAETAYREAIVLDANVKDWQLGLAKALLNQKKYQESIAVLEEILLLEPENEIIWISQANAYLGLDDAETAVAIQEIVDRLGKSSPESLEFMGNIYMSRSLNELALKYYRKAIQKDPNRPVKTHIDTADILVGRGAFDEAKTLIADIRSTYSNRFSTDDDTRLLRMESHIAMNDGLTEVFIPILEKLIENDPLDGDALMMLADHYTSQDTNEGYARADLYYDRVTKIPDIEVKGLIAWARSYVAREQYGKAIPHLERANTLDPRDFVTRYLEQVRKVHLANLGL